MHDPMVVAFDIPRPWPQRSRHHDAKTATDSRWAARHFHRHIESVCGHDCPNGGHAMFPWWKPSSYSKFWVIAGRGIYWTTLLTVWHVEPGGHDMGEVCKHWRTVDGQRRRSDRWRWHVHHWHLQVPALQGARRRLLTRCAWCGGRSGSRGNQVNVSHSWDGEPSRWWQGSRGLYHGDCSTVQSAHRTCTCVEPVPEHGSHGLCARCGRFYGYGRTETWRRRAELIRVGVPERTRDAEKVAAIVAATKPIESDDAR